jgi:hypothetical protein
MAQPTLTVYAYGNVDALHGIFNSVAMIMNTADFRDMIRVAVVIGFLVVSILMVNPKNISKGWNWFICVAVLSGVLLTPKATVTIEDRLGLQPPAVVANVPWALAVVASVKTAIGATLTDLAETAFQTIPDDDKALPSELAYLEHGVMFGNRLVRSSREAEFDALNPQGDTLNYFRNCIFPGLGREGTPGAFERSTGLLQQISDPNPALFSTYHDAANGGALVSAPCDQVFAKLEPDITAAGGAALKAMATRMMPGVDAASAEAKVSESLVAIYGKARLADNAATAHQRHGRRICALWCIVERSCGANVREHAFPGGRCDERWLPGAGPNGRGGPANCPQYHGRNSLRRVSDPVHSGNRLRRARPDSNDQVLPIRARMGRTLAVDVFDRQLPSNAGFLSKP